MNTIFSVLGGRFCVKKYGRLPAVRFSQRTRGADGVGRGRVMVLGFCVWGLWIGMGQPEKRFRAVFRLLLGIASGYARLYHILMDNRMLSFMSSIMTLGAI